LAKSALIILMLAHKVASGLKNYLHFRIFVIFEL